MPLLFGLFTFSLSVLVVLVVPIPSESLVQLKLLVPASPGGVWDQTGRAMERALREEKLVSGTVRITNLSGAGGAIGLAEFTRTKNDGTALMVIGLGML